jgi:hypothetical protein
MRRSAPQCEAATNAYQMGNIFQTLILLNNVNSSGSTNKITDVATVVRLGVRGQVAGSGDIFICVCVCVCVNKTIGTWSMICG